MSLIYSDFLFALIRYDSAVANRIVSNMLSYIMDFIILFIIFLFFCDLPVSSHLPVTAMFFPSTWLLRYVPRCKALKLFFVRYSIFLQFVLL